MLDGVHRFNAFRFAKVVRGCVKGSNNRPTNGNAPGVDKAMAQGFGISPNRAREAQPPRRRGARFGEVPDADLLRRAAV